MPINYEQIYSCPTRPICTIATIAIGLCRFACVLFLPDMSGPIHIINAAGFFVGALGASAMIRRAGWLNTFGISVGSLALSFAVSALTVQLTAFGAELARLGAGQ